MIRQFQLVEGLALGLTAGCFGLALAALTRLLISFVNPTATMAGTTSLSPTPDLALVVLFPRSPLWRVYSSVSRPFFSLSPEVLLLSNSKLSQPGQPCQVPANHRLHANCSQLAATGRAGLFEELLKNLKSVDVGFPRITPDLPTKSRMASYEPAACSLYKRLLVTLLLRFRAFNLWA